MGSEVLVSKSVSLDKKHHKFLENSKVMAALGLFELLVVIYEQTERQVILQACLVDPEKHKQGDGFYTIMQEGIHGGYR